MQPGIRNLKLYKGATDTITFWMKSGTVPINLTGVVFSGYITDGKNRSDLAMDKAISVFPIEGKVVVVIDETSKEPLGLRGKWSIKATWADGTTSRILEGKIEVIPQP